MEIKEKYKVVCARCKKEHPISERIEIQKRGSLGLTLCCPYCCHSSYYDNNKMNQCAGIFWKKDDYETCRSRSNCKLYKEYKRNRNPLDLLTWVRLKEFRGCQKHNI